MSDATSTLALDRDGSLTIVAYHYIRDLPRSRFPRLKGLMLDRFRQQVVDLCERFEMASLETALAFIAGRPAAGRHLCLLTFDDGLKEHYEAVLPILAERRIQGLFFPATACLDGRVATVHKIHFLMADMELAAYRTALLERVTALSPVTVEAAPAGEVHRAYPWDPPEVGRLKYLANFGLPPEVRDRLFDDLFAWHFGDEATFARELYLSWDQAREMQDAGMVIGGHSDAHSSLAGMAAERQDADLARCASLLRDRLRPQALWPFAYPYGRFDDATIDSLRRLGFDCAFTVEPGLNVSPGDRFRLRRFDTNQILPGARVAGIPAGTSQ